MARITCIECGARVASFTHASHDEDGHGTDPICDTCSGIGRA